MKAIIIEQTNGNNNNSKTTTKIAVSKAIYYDKDYYHVWLLFYGFKPLTGKTIVCWWIEYYKQNLFSMQFNFF